jgi:Rrf2 family transcriptional regulator, cysteine metabolism repressor
MKLSTRSRYGLRAVVELANHYGQGPRAMSEIASEQQLSRKYLDSLFSSLKVAGLVISRRGPGGGWTLTRAPAEITVTEVLRALEGSLAMVSCVDFPATCSRTPSCATREVYVAIHEAVVGVLDGMSIQSLCERRIELEHLINGSGAGVDLCVPGD